MKDQNYEDDIITLAINNDRTSLIVSSVVC